MYIRLLVLITLVLSTILFSPNLSESSHETAVKGYVKKSGKHSPSYKRKSHNKSKLDNYGAKGNLNPNTGKVGREDPFARKVMR